MTQHKYLELVLPCTGDLYWSFASQKQGRANLVIILMALLKKYQIFTSTLIKDSSVLINDNTQTHRVNIITKQILTFIISNDHSYLAKQYRSQMI